LALISVPGDFAAAEARKALRRGLNVLMFSDNVPLEDELSLKQEARDLGLLMMGPDCGTAIINGAPLGFANVVNRGGIGIVGASGTGTQEVSALISEAGQGISHAIGVGGRDLKKEIGGITSLMAMDALEQDEATESVVLISKPPHPDVTSKIIARIGESAKRYIVCFLGAEKLDLPANARQATTLREAAELAVDGAKIGAGFNVADLAAGHKAQSGQIRGLFCGGTLCAEAQVVLGSGGRKIASNAAIPGVPGLDDATNEAHDRLIDLGADEFTVGRAHPMIDPSLRDEMVREALGDKEVRVILVDLVIGYGAHADPAGHLAEVLGVGDKSQTAVIASVTGTETDPQIRSRQVAKLESAGVIVAPSNAHACELALAMVTN
ncbi:MAG: transcriptional regulator, partial [Albidovulum sp.]